MTAFQEEAVRRLSSFQERMWLLDQIAPGAAAPSLFHTADIAGPLAPALLARAFDEVVRRHEILRTTFAAPGGVPAPVVAPAAPRPLPLVDLAGLAEAVRAPELARLSSAARRRPFDLAAGPLVRVALVRLAADRHLGLVTAHPIVFDGGSSLVLWREAAALYEALTEGRPSPLPELPFQFADRPLRQGLHPTDAPAGEAPAGDLGPWRRDPAPPLPVLRLPADFDRASARGFLAGSVRRELPEPLAAALRGLGGRRGAPLFSVLLAAWAAVLARAGGEEDLLVGTPGEGRQGDAEGLIGPFRTTRVLRVHPRPDRGFAALVDEVRQTVSGAATQPDLPPEGILTAPDLPRRPSHPGRTPPFQALFFLRRRPAPPLAAAGLSIALSPPDPTADLAGEVFELGLVAEEKPARPGEEGGLGLRLVYDAHRFTEATAARLLDHLAAFLAAATAAPERPVAELPLLSDSDRRQLLVWSDGGGAGGTRERGQDAALPPLVHHAFFARAAATPDAPAVVAEGREVSYGELARLVRSLASRLVAQGIGPESRVALAVERSPRMVAAVLAVLAAGGAYVPLDPASPVERLAVILRDIGQEAGRERGHGAATAAALLTGGGRPAAAAGEAARLAALPGLQVLDLDEIWPALESEPLSASDPAGGLTLEAGRESLAYVIYTSGSTGTPKGVMIRHGGLASYVSATLRDLALAPADRMLQFASLSFDASAEELFCPLSSGAAMILRTDEMLAGAPAFLGACTGLKVTVCDLPTVFWQELVDRVDAGEAVWPPTLRLLVTGGERPLPERVARLRRQLGPGARVLNSYGPTEVTVAATSHTLEGEADGPPYPLREFPIGRPLPGARAYLLDGARELCPPGIPGEIAIGGESLARGYLGRPDLTARTFLPDPFAGRPGARMYTTGDLARHRLDGEEAGALEYLGRIDGQVKVRGFRIELAEIEGALAQHPAVAEAAVGVDERRAGERALAAWWVARPGAGATASELRGFLKKRLPEPMVPSHFTRLQTLPRNTSGKLDRRALPLARPETTAAGGAAGYEVPATPAEEAVAYVWRDLLNLPRVGRQDDFFALGGRSLHLPRVRHRLEQELGVRLPLASLLERTTAAALALAAEERLLEELEREVGAAG